VFCASSYFLEVRVHYKNSARVCSVHVCVCVCACACVCVCLCACVCVCAYAHVHARVRLGIKAPSMMSAERILAYMHKTPSDEGLFSKKEKQVSLC